MRYSSTFLTTLALASQALAQNGSVGSNSTSQSAPGASSIYTSIYSSNGTTPSASVSAAPSAGASGSGSDAGSDISSAGGPYGNTTSGVPSGVPSGSAPVASDATDGSANGSGSGSSAGTPSNSGQDDEYPLPTNLPSSLPIFSCPVGTESQPGLTYNIFEWSESISNLAAMTNLAADIERQTPIASGVQVQSEAEIQGILAGYTGRRIVLEMSGFFIPPSSGSFYFSESSNSFSTFQIGAGSSCSSDITGDSLNPKSELFNSARFSRRSSSPVEINLSSDYSYPSRYIAFYDGSEVPSLAISGPNGNIDLSAFSQRTFPEDKVPSIPGNGVVVICGECAKTETQLETSYVTVCDEDKSGKKTTYTTDCEYTINSCTTSGPHVVVVNADSQTPAYSTVTRTSYTTLPCETGYTTSEVVYVTEVCDLCTEAAAGSNVPAASNSPAASNNAVASNSGTASNSASRPHNVDAVAGPSNATASGTGIGLSNAGVSIRPEMYSVVALVALFL